MIPDNGRQSPFKRPSDRWTWLNPTPRVVDILPGLSWLQLVQFLQLHSLSPCRKRQTWPNWKANNKWHWPVRCAQQFASGVNKWSLQIAPRLTTTESSSAVLSSSYCSSLGISVAVSPHSFWDITNAKLCPHYSKTEWLSVCECVYVWMCVCVCVPLV